MEKTEFQNYFNKEMLILQDWMMTLPWQDKSFYSNYMKQTYGFTSKSFELLKLVGKNLENMGDENASRFNAHSEEEFGHEHLAINDVLALGFERNDIPVFEITNEFMDTQFNYANEKHPLSIYGWILMLETLPNTVGRDLLTTLVGAHGKKACNFLRVHCEEDEEHILEAWKVVNELNPTVIEEIQNNFKTSLKLYKALLSECLGAAKAS